MYLYNYFNYLYAFSFQLFKMNSPVMLIAASESFMFFIEENDYLVQNTMYLDNLDFLLFAF